MSNSPPILTVASYNIQLGMRAGLPSVARVLNTRRPLDLVAIQEIGDHWLMGPEGDSPSRLAGLLELPHYIFVPTIEESRDDGSSARYGHALYSRWPIQSRQIYDLPRCKDEPRKLLRCRLTTPDSVSVEVYATHLSHLPSDRPDQGVDLMQRIDHDSGEEVDARFLVGDLNVPPSEPWMADFLKRWIDAGADRRQPTFPAHRPERRIDYVLGDGASLVSADVLSESEASDHRPLVTNWELQPH